MGKARHILETFPVAEEAISEPAFTSTLQALIKAPPEAPFAARTYSFKLPAILNQPSCFNKLMDALFDLSNQGGYLQVLARINSDQDEEDAYLWDATCHVDQGLIIVRGFGDCYRGDGEATLGFNRDGDCETVIQDKIRGKHIESDEAELECIALENCSEPLYRLLKQTFGPSAQE